MIEQPIVLMHILTKIRAAQHTENDLLALHAAISAHENLRLASLKLSHEIESNTSIEWNCRRATRVSREVCKSATFDQFVESI